MDVTADKLGANPRAKPMPKVVEELHSRPPMERILRIHDQLQARRFPNCTTLGRDIEVCTRTIKRDLDFMKYRLGLPIEYDQRRNGYHYSHPVPTLPSLPVSEGELFALLIAKKAVAQYHGTPFYRPLEAAYRRLTQQLPSDRAFTVQGLEQAVSFRPFAPDDTDLEMFEVLTRALKEHRTVKFRYRNLGALKAQGRRVNPYHLACTDNHWYLIGFDLNREGMRNFSLTRLEDPELTADTFSVPKDFDPDEYLRGSLVSFKGTQDFEVVIEFDRWGADLVRGRTWHASQQVEQLPDGRMRLTMRLNSVEEVERWVLSFGTHATVASPPQLADRIEKIASYLQARYADSRRRREDGTES
jgi:proteasome accessory factor B